MGSKLKTMKLIFTKVQCSHFATKDRWKRLRNDTEIHEVKNNESKENFLSVFGMASTGALGIKALINNERNHGNINIARRPYPLYYFNISGDMPKVSIKNISAGYGFTLFSGKCSKRGWQVFGCGINSDSQLGFQDRSSDRNGYKIIMEPQAINLPTKFLKINHIGCGRAHSIVVGDVDCTDPNPQLICSFGNNVHGQCGRQIIEKEIFSNSAIVHQLSFHKRVKQVECGELTTFLLADDGTVYGCGSNRYGQLASKEFSRNSSLVQITGGLEKKTVTQISSLCNTVLALTDDGEVWAWGNNEYGVIFDALDDSCLSTPRRLQMPNNIGKIVQVSCGNTVCAVLDELGQVHTWGMYYLGHGPSIQVSNYPKMIHPNLFGGGLKAFNQKHSSIVDIACGFNFCTAITSSGNLYIWGKDCILKKQNQTFPVRMALTFNARKTFIGADHAIIMGKPFM